MSKIEWKTILQCILNETGSFTTYYAAGTLCVDIMDDVFCVNVYNGKITNFKTGEVVKEMTPHELAAAFSIYKKTKGENYFYTRNLDQAKERLGDDFIEPE